MPKNLIVVTQGEADFWTNLLRPQCDWLVYTSADVAFTMLVNIGTPLPTFNHPGHFCAWIDGGCK